MKFVYVVTGEKDSFAYWMCLLSSATARIHHPDAEITWISNCGIDPFFLVFSQSVLGSKRFYIVTENCQGFNAIQSSRYLKIRIPHLVEGECLYLDNDTIIVKEISEILPRSYVVAGCKNTDKPAGECDMEGVASYFNPMGWSLPLHPYINGGVLGFGGSSEARAFSDAWLAYWKKQVSVLGKHNDQPSLNRTLFDFSDIFMLLDQLFNCQVRHISNVSRQARIFHYFGSNVHLIRNSSSPFAELERLKATDPEAFRNFAEKVAHRDFPFLIKLPNLLRQLRHRQLRLFIYYCSRGRVRIGSRFPRQPS